MWLLVVASAGNTLTIATNGITWTNSVAGRTNGSSSLTIVFQRDSLGRITNIVDAAGAAMQYQYDTNGNLVAFIDRAGNTNSFNYDPEHRLLGIVNGS